MKCSVCQSELERVNNNILECKTCGFGFKPNKDGKIPNAKDIMKDTMFEMKMLKLLFPTASDTQLVNKHQFHEHRMKNHPTSREGYCEYCNTTWEKLSDKEFYEKLGYKKSSWYKPDGTPIRDQEFWSSVK